MGRTWGELQVVAKDRKAWPALVEGQCFIQGYKAAATRNNVLYPLLASARRTS